MSEETKYECSRCGASLPWSRLTSNAAGNLFCPDCLAQLDPQNETARTCPVDGAEMKKKAVSGLFLMDKCPLCEGVWLDKNELQIVEKNTRETAYAEGRMRGFIWGMIIG